jgi:hypothetical protein
VFGAFLTQDPARKFELCKGQPPRCLLLFKERSPRDSAIRPRSATAQWVHLPGKLGAWTPLLDWSWLNSWRGIASRGT